MKAYKFNEKKEFKSVVECQIDPRATERTGKDVWLLPANATWKKPLPYKPGFLVVFNGTDWEYRAEPKKPEPPEPSETEKLEAEKWELQGKLEETDYKIIKCAEAQFKNEPLPYDIKQVSAERQAWRDRINEIEGLLDDQN